MGVPALFRWLSRKYPKIISPVLEEEARVVDGILVPPQYSNPNINGELDNLYLDMNGIVHPCSHPENKPAPENEDEMLLAVFEYTDRVLDMARPRKILMIAVDGVAPRAKMNQQRARRFKSVQEAKLKDEETERIAKEAQSFGQVIDESVKKKKTWDSNAITPGTPFMDKLALGLRYWTAYKLATDPGWKDLQVVISDATVPGEGEHKIMNFIRSQRSDVEYNPNTRHAIYGLDADLIFLGLATHEPHFRVLREDVFAQDQRMSLRNQLHMTPEEKERLKEQDAKKPFLWLNINVLREYLEIELNIPRLSFKFDLERAIDDWIFMCFFCGNDFLPHLPSLDVRDSSIDLLVTLWKQVLPRLKTYITCDGTLNLENVQILLAELGQREDEIFRSRHAKEQRRNGFDKRRRTAQEQSQTIKNHFLSNVTKGKADKGTLTPVDNIPLFDVDGNSVGKVNLTNSELVQLRSEVTKAGLGDAGAQQLLNKVSAGEAIDEVKPEVIETANKANISAAAALRQQLLASKTKTSPLVPEKRKAEDISSTTSSDSESSSSNIDDGDDPIKLYEPGYKNRYYKTKFHVEDSELPELRKQVVEHYIEGIAWTLLYYYQGCPSWNWFYPYHYAPFASDFLEQNLKDMTLNFIQGEPFLPYEQLMAVLPAASGHTLPPIFRPLMSEPESPIIDFYPEEFPLDMNGKKMPWQAIVLLPFIDEKRLLEVVRAQYPKLTDAEKSRNVRKEEILVISKHNPNFEKFAKLYKDKDVHAIDFHFHKSSLAGRVSPLPTFEFDSVLDCPVQGEHQYTDIPTNLFLQAEYKMPKKTTSKSIILTGYIKHSPVLKQEDKDGILYGNNGRGGGYRGNRYNNNYNNSGSPENIIQVGPSGDSVYSVRFGGFKSFLLLAQQHHQQMAAQQNVQRFVQSHSQHRRYDNGQPPQPTRNGVLRR